MMTGRQFLDIAAIFKASRGVALRHIALRRHQFDVYGKTSSLVKAINKQASKTTPTSNSGSAFSTKRSKDDVYPTQAKQNDTSRPSTNLPRQENSDRAQKTEGTKSALDKDNFYEGLEKSTIGQALSGSELKVQQKEAARYPLQDGSIPPAGSDIGLSNGDQDSFSSVSLKERKKDPLVSKTNKAKNVLQPISSNNQNIPTPTEEKQPTIEKAEGRGDSIERLPPISFGPRSPATPRIQTQTYLSGEANTIHSKSPEQSIPEVQAIPEQGQPSDEMYSEIFHSPRVARLLKVMPEKGRPPKSLDLHGVQGTPLEQSQLSKQRDQDSFNIRPTAQPEFDGSEGTSVTKNKDLFGHPKDKDVQEEVEDIAKNSPTASSFASQVIPAS